MRPSSTCGSVMFSVCVLLYGDHFDLAKNVLGSIVASRPRQDLLCDLRIGLNDVCPETRRYVWDLCGRELLKTPVYVYEPPSNVGKYTLMRRMFYDDKRPLGSHIMWFDDDTHLDVNPETWSWWLTVAELARQHLMLGQIWHITQRGNQYLGIQQQPWYGGKKVHARHKFVYATGAWWVVRSDFIRQWNYPFPELYHNGGDSILGELVRQRGNKDLHYFDDGLEINVGGLPGRRGIAKDLRTEVYPWQNYLPGQVPDLAHHNFECRIHCFDRS